MIDFERKHRNKTSYLVLFGFIIFYIIISILLFAKGLGPFAIVGLFVMVYQYFAIKARRLDTAQDISQINEYYYELEEEKLREEEEYLRWRRQKEQEKMRNARRKQARRNSERHQASNSEFKEQKEVNIEFGKESAEEITEKEEIAK